MALMLRELKVLHKTLYMEIKSQSTHINDMVNIDEKIQIRAQMPSMNDIVFSDRKCNCVASIFWQHRKRKCIFLTCCTCI